MEWQWFDLEAPGPRGCYELAISKEACFNMRQAKATKCKPARVLG